MGSPSLRTEFVSGKITYPEYLEALKKHNKVKLEELEKSFAKLSWLYSILTEKVILGQKFGPRITKLLKEVKEDSFIAIFKANIIEIKKFFPKTILEKLKILSRREIRFQLDELTKTHFSDSQRRKSWYRVLYYLHVITKKELRKFSK